MSLQSVFDRVVIHSRAQPRQATSADSDLCLYRAPNGDKCFVGCLIPDERYSNSMEGMSLGGSSDSGRLMKIVFGDVEWDPTMVVLLTQLQSIHDRYRPEKWPALLQKTADNFGLTVPA